MKRILLSMIAVCAAFTMNAQVDTLTEFFTGGPTFYTAGAGNGYVTGTNIYEDKGKYQRFDVSKGISNNGTITGCLVWVALKNDAGGSFNVDVIDYAGGTAGATLASETVTLASVDTTSAGFGIAEGAVGYNVSVTFSSPVSVTVASDLLIGITLPTTAAAGDTVALVSNTIGDFPAAATYTWELWSDDSWNDMSTAWGGFDAALAVYPVANFVAGLSEADMNVSVYPNPANDVLNISAAVEVATVNIISMDGKVVSTTSANGTNVAVDVAGLNSGVYFYEVKTDDGSVVRNTFMKK